MYGIAACSLFCAYHIYLFRNEESKKAEGVNVAGLIIGIVFLIVIIAAVAIFLKFIWKKRSSEFSSVLNITYLQGFVLRSSIVIAKAIKNKTLIGEDSKISKSQSLKISKQFIHIWIYINTV